VYTYFSVVPNIRFCN